MKLTVEQFVTLVRALPLSANQAAAAEAAFVASAPNELPKELIRREALTEFQVRYILAGRGADLTVGRYLLLSELGAGGMGTVFKARDTAMDRMVALKLIRDERLMNPAALARFQQEVRAAARLAHPNIVRAYDAGTANGKHFLVTELVIGHDLGHELARRGALPPGEACEFARQAAVGLQHAHEQGLTHRDIKPSNLLFSTAERLVKVADFGLARMGDAGSGGLTTDDTVIGTPDYIAPEQAISATAADIRSDLYSLGCTLYHFLTGHVPFPRDTAYAKLRAHEREEPPPLDDACHGLNPALVAVVQKLMAKHPTERFQTPLEVVDALIQFCPKPSSSTGAYRLASAASRSAPPPLPASASGPVVLPTPVPTAEPIPEAYTVPEPQPAPKSNKALALAGIAGGALALVVLVVVLTRGSVAIVPNPQPNQNNINVTVPVSVTVNLDDWAKAREPGVTIALGDRVLKRTDFAEPLSLPPGRYTLVAKKGGKELEARAFDVKEGDGGKAVVARVAAVPDPAGEPGVLRQWGAKGEVIDIRPSPDGKWFVTAECIGNPREHVGAETFKERLSETSTRRYDWNSTAVLNTWGGNLGYRVALFPQHDLAADCVRNMTHPLVAHKYALRTLDLRSGASTYTRPNDETLISQRVHQLRASADGKRLLWVWGKWSEAGLFAGAPVGEVIVLGITVTPERLLDWEEKNRFQGNVACFDPSGNRALGAKGKALQLWDERTGKPLRDYAGAKADVLTVEMAEDGSRVAAGDQNGTVFAWKTDASDPTAVCIGHKGKVNAVGVTNDGARVVSAGEDGTVRVWDASSGKELHQYKHDGPVYALAMSPGGKRVLTGGADKTIRLWQLPP